MSQTVQIQFADKMVSFETFLSAIRIVVKEEVGKIVGKRPFISERKAINTYGRENVKRWVAKGDVELIARGKDGRTTRKYYRVSELEACACRVQDYLHT